MIHALRVLNNDPRFAALIQKYGKPDFGRGWEPFPALVRSIVYQQISGKAAASIFKKFSKLYPKKKFPTPRDVASSTVRRLRSAGISPQKATYIKDLAEKFLDGTIQPRAFRRMTNDEIIAHLVRVKGIGVWTAHMFLIFTLKRPDVLPTGDLGIKKGFQIVYKLKRLPDHQKMESLSRPWRAHASVASWYLWRVADGEKVEW